MARINKLYDDGKIDNAKREEFVAVVTLIEGLDDKKSPEVSQTEKLISVCTDPALKSVLESHLREISATESVDISEALEKASAMGYPADQIVRNGLSKILGSKLYYADPENVEKAKEAAKKKKEDSEDSNE
jgi:hypothetical protein